MKSRSAVRSKKPSARASVETALQKLRSDIDRSDRELLHALGLRFKAVGKIGKLKVAHGLPFLQTSRWEEVMKERMQWGLKCGLEPSFVILLYQSIHQEALRVQETIRSKK